MKYLTQNNELYFKLDPVAKGRPRFSNRGGFARAFTPKETRDFESMISQLAKLQYKSEPIVEPVSITVKFFIKKPHSVKKRVYPSVRPDLENYLKSLIDGCNGILWKDDSQICRIEATKEYSTSEGFIVLNIEPMIQ